MIASQSSLVQLRRECELSPSLLCFAQPSTTSLTRFALASLNLALKDQVSFPFGGV